MRKTLALWWFCWRQRVRAWRRALRCHEHRRGLRRRRAAFRRLGFEPLEARALLAAWTTQDYAASTAYWNASSVWFESLSKSRVTDGGAAAIAAVADVDAGSQVGVEADGAHYSEWIVRLTADALQSIHSVADAAAFLDSSALGLQVVAGLGLPGQLLIRATGALADVEDYLTQNTALAYNEPNRLVSVQATPNDPSYGSLYGLHNTGQTGGTADADIDAPEAWNIATGSRSIVVGVIDTGIDYNHVDLAANIWTNPGETAGNGIDDDGNGFIDDVHGYDFVNNDGDPMDDHYHGTHVAGTIGAVGNNGVGVVGVNWAVSMMGLKFLNSSGSGTTANAIRAVNYATMMRSTYGVNVRMTSNSWGGGAFDQGLLDAINAGGAADVLFVAAAGNSGLNTDTSPQYPAAYDSQYIVSVAATDANDALASFSNYGATTVDLGAPGVGIYSTKPGNSYQSLSGTSMATPHVSGVAALALSVDPGRTALQLKDLLLNNVDPTASLSGKTVTGGRLNANKVLNALGLSVATTNPAAGSTVTASPTSFVVNFTSAYAPSSVAADDFTVNGVAADSFTLTDADTVTFTFNTSPVTTQGMQTMAMAAGALTRLSDGSASTAFSGAFRYDAVLLAPVSTTPVGGSTAQLPLTTLDVQFNEAVAPASIDVNDLTISQGTVTAAAALDATTVRYTLSGITTESTFTFSLPAGALTDVYGNPGGAYSGSFALDVGIVPVPVPLVRVAPAGSLIYQGSATSSILTPGDADGFTITLDAGQVLTLVSHPTSAGLRPTIELRDPSNAVIAAAAAAADGQDVVVQTAPIATAGVYMISVSGAAGTTGGQSLQITLNSAVETESHDGATNGTRATAQNLDGGFLNLSGSATRAAVLGTAFAGSATAASETFESGALGSAWSTYSSDSGGRIQVTGTNGVHGGSYAMYMDRSSSGVLTLNEAIWTVNLAGLGGATLSFWHSEQGDEETPFAGDFTGHYNADGVAISADGNTWHPIWSAVNQTTGVWTQYTFDLAAAAASAGMSLGANFKIKFQQYDDFPLTSDGRAWDDVVITAPAPNDQDWYSFTPVAGEDTSLTLKALGAASPTIQLFDSAGNLVAAGVTNTNADRQEISRFVAPTAGTYYVLISSATTTDYTLLVDRSLAFDDGRNESIAAAQTLTSAEGYVSGALATVGGLGRLYAYDAAVNMIRELNPATGAVLRSFASPVGEAAGPDFGTATSPAGLWVGGASASPIYLLDPDSGAVIRTIPNPGLDVSGLAHRNGELFVRTDANSTVTVLDVDDGAVLRTFTISSATSESLAAADDYLYASSGTTLYVLNPQTGATVGTVALSGVTHVVEGLGVVGDELFVADYDRVEVYDRQTFALLRTFTGLTDLDALGADGNAPATGDYYSLTLAAGAVLQISTATPSDGGGEFVNLLDPLLAVYGPGGALVASDDDGAADGRNAALTYTAAAAGTYYVRVVASPSSTAPFSVGEYVLRYSGASAAPPTFAVAGVTPADGATLTAAPTQITVTFVDHVLLTSLDASDLTIDGVAATSVTIVDGATAVFAVPGGLTSGAHQIAVAAGAVLDLQATPIAAFNSQFTIDVAPPQIVASSIQQGDVIATGSLTYTVAFSESMKADALDATDFTLHGNLRNINYAATSFGYDASAAVLTISYANLPEDSYTLTLLSGDGRFEDAAGNDLDGEPAFPTPPNHSGDGTAGGDFVVTFSTDVPTTAFPAPLAAQPMPGSLIYRSSTVDPYTAVVGAAGDADDVTIALDAGQTLGAVITPSTNLQASLSVFDPSDNLLGTFEASAAGAKLIVQPIAVATAGTYRLRFSGVGGTVGLTGAVLTLNAAVEAESLGGTKNDARATAQSIEGTSVALGGGADRLAVVGTTDVGTGSYQAAAVTPTFIDISTTGTKSTVVGDDSSAALTSTELGSFTFSFFGTVYDRLWFSTNGLISFTNADSSYSNSNLSTSPSEPVIAALWDDLYIDNTGTGAASRNIYWQLIGSGANQQLVIQWNNARRLGGSTYFTFEAVLSTDGTVQLNYGNTVDSTVVGSATVGVKAAGTSNPPRLLVSYNQAPGSLVGPNLSTRLSFPPQTDDYYSFGLAAGQSVSLAVTEAVGNCQLLLQDAAGNVVATGAATGDLDSWIGNYVAGASGTYYAVVTGAQNGGLDYDLVVTRGAAFDDGANHTLATAQDIDGPRTVLGYLDSSSDYYALQVVGTKTLTISTTTPGDGPGAFGNVLDPAVELYDSSGTLLASSDDHAPDGRNARLPFVAVAGTYYVRVLAAGGSGEYVLNVAESAVISTPPSITPVADQVIDEDGSVSVTFTVTDVDTPLDQLIVDATSGDTALLPNSNLMLTDLGGGRWRLTATPAANRYGSAAATVRVSDGTQVGAPFTLTVNPINDAPSFTAGPDQAVSGTTAPQTVVGWARNVSAGPYETGQTLAFQVSNDNPSLFTVQPTIGADGTLSYTPSGVLGTAVVTVVLKDSGGTAGGGVDTSAPQTFTIQSYWSSLPAGTLDSSFDGDGIRTIPSSLGSYDVGRDVALQADGKIVVVGLISTGKSAVFGTSMAARFNADGTLDTTFGTGGTVAFSNSFRLTAVEVLSDGNILIGGDNGSSLYVARLNTDGTFDTTFGTNGAAKLSYGNTLLSSLDSVSMAVQNDGKIVLARATRPSGSSFNRVAVARLTASGAADTTFNGSGYNVVAVSAAGNDAPNDVVVQSDGKIVVAGTTNLNAGAGNDFFAARFTSAGALDAAFNSVGYTVINVGTSGSSNDTAYRVALQSDGKIVLGGIAGSDFGLVRLNADGTPDASFDSDGKVTTHISGTDQINALAIQADGKIVAGGFSSAASLDFALARYTTTGALDTTFNGTGKKTQPVGTGNDQIYGLALQTDGKIVVGGLATHNADGGDFVVGRFNADGSLDTSFNNGTGTNTINFGGGSGRATASLVLPDGRILVGGYFTENGASLSGRRMIWMLNPDGSLDTSFGTGGYSSGAPFTSSNIVSMAVQSDGKILFLDAASYRINRLNADGTTDATFGSSGAVSLSTWFSSVSAVAVQSDGAILVAGYKFNSTTSNYEFSVVRLTSTGALDAAFNGTGWATVDVGAGNDFGKVIALQSDGRILVAGYGSNGANDDFALVRLNADGSLDTSFAGTGKILTPIGTGRDWARSVLVQSDGKIVVGGYAYTTDGGDAALVRYLPDGALDATFGTGGVVITAVTTSTDDVFSVQQQADGKLLTVGYGTVGGTSTFAVTRHLVDGRLDSTFDADGIALTPVGAGAGQGLAAAVQGDGKLIVAGYSDGGDAFNATVLRYLLRGTSGGPSVTPIAAQTTDEDTTTAAIDFVVSHSTLPASSLSVTASSADATLVPDGNFVLTNLGDGNWRLTATPAADRFGSTLVTVTASDGTLFYATTFTLTVNSVNDPPANLSLSNAAVAENAGADATVGTFTTIDVDSSGDFTYALVDGAGGADNGTFSLSGNTLRAGANFDFETKNSYSIRVRTTDAGGLSFEKIFTIAVTNVNETPTDVALSATSLPENAGANAVVGDFTTTDVDAGDTFTYTLVNGTGGADNGAFHIAGNTLRAVASFDFEAKNVYSVRVRTTDAGGLFFEKAFTITVADVNETPTDVALSATSLPENAGANAVVGDFTTTDVDAGDTFTYTLVNGEGGADNEAFRISGNTLRAVAGFDFETKNSYSIRVRTTDAGGLFFEKAFTITVANVNDAPTDLAPSNTILAENAGANAVVGTFTTTDQDAADAFTYALVDGEGSNDNASFHIADGVLRADASFDFETRHVYSIRVRTTDAGGLFFEKAFTIVVTNVNETPTDVAPSATSLLENAGPNVVVGTFATTDVDAGETFTYALVDGDGGADNGAFYITGDTLRAGVSFNFETRNVYSIRVRTTDAGGLFFEKAFTITVADVNEMPSFTKGADQTATSDGARRTATGWATNVSAGGDFGQTVDFQVSVDRPELFSSAPTIAADGTLSYTPAVDVFGTAVVTVRLHDDGGTADGGVDTSPPETFAITIYRPYHVAVLSQPTSVAAGAPFDLSLKIVDDATGDVVPNYSGPVTIEPADDAGDATLSTIGTGRLTVNAVGGVATFAGLTLDRSAAEYRLRITTLDLAPHVTNALSVVPAAASRLVPASAPPSGVTAGEAFGLSVEVLDALGNRAVNFRGLLNVALSVNPGGAKLSGTTIAAVVDGRATFAGLSLDKAAAGYVLAIGGVGPTKLTTGPIEVRAAAPASLVVTTQPPTVVTAGAAFGVSAKLLDRFGNLATGFDDNVTASLVTNPAGGALGGATTTAASGGLVSFANLTLDKAAAGYGLQLSAAGLAPVALRSVTVRAGAADHLAVATTPTSVAAGAPWQVTVTALDAQGNLASSFAGVVTASLAVNPGGGTLSGTLAVTAVGGKATFTNLALDAAETGYVLEFAAPGLTAARSDPLDVTALAARLVVVKPPPASVAAGAAFGLSVKVVDAVTGALLSGYDGPVTIALDDAPGGATLGTVGGGASTVTAQNGTATFTGLTLTKAGAGYTLRVATPDGLKSTVSPVTTAPLTVTPAAPTTLTLVASPPASVAAGEAFGLSVQVFDRFGNLATNFGGALTAAIGVNPAAGKLSGAVAAKVVGGTARFTNLALDKAGSGYVLAIGGVGPTKLATGPIDVAAAEAVRLVFATVPPAAVTAGAGFSVAARLLDRFGNLATGFAGDVMVALRSNPGGAVLGGATQVAAAGGLATFANLTLDKAAAGYVLQLSTTDGRSLPPITTGAVKVVPAAASVLAVTTEPSTVTAGAAFKIVVTARDPFGNTVVGFSGEVTAALAVNPGGSALGGATTVKAVAGIATFAKLTLNQAAAGYVLQFTAAGLTAASDPIGVTAAAAAKLVLAAAPPANVAVGAPFGLSVQVVDPYGNVVSSFAKNAVVALAAAPPGGALLGAPVGGAPFAAGLASFAGLSFNKAGSYKLRLTAAKLSLVTDLIVVA